jgi:hypothetical protein
MGTTPLIPVFLQAIPIQLTPDSRLPGSVKHRGHFGQTDGLKSIRYWVALAAGIHGELAIRLRVLDGQIKTLLGLRRPASFDARAQRAEGIPDCRTVT